MTLLTYIVIQAYSPDSNAEDEFNDEFWDSPPVLYHATQDENVKDIMKHVLIADNVTRGI